MRLHGIVRKLAAVGLATCLAPTAGGAPPAPQRPQRTATFGGAVSVVRVAVVVRDSNGALVRGLTRKDFSVTEDDKPQTIESFHFEEVPTEWQAEPEAPMAPAPPILKPQPGAAPGSTAVAAPPSNLSGRRMVVLLFDSGEMEPDQLARAGESALHYVETRMSPADLVAVGSIGTTGLEVNQDFTADRAVLRRALSKVAGAGQGGEETTLADASNAADQTNEADSFAADTTELDLFDVDRRLRAIEDLADALAHIEQKKSVIYYSNGMSGAATDNQVKLRAAIDRAVKANLAVYPVDTRGLEAVIPGGDARQASNASADAFSGRGFQNQLDQRIASQETLSELASDTGGKPFFDANDFSGVYERMMSDTSAYYVVGYSSSNPAQDGKFRRIKVGVSRPGLRVEHRSGYYAPRDFAHARREDREGQLTDQLLSDLSLTDLPVWLQSSYFRIAENRFYVPLSIAVPGSAIPFVRQSEKDRATLDLIGIVRDEAQRAVARLRETVDIATEGAADVRHKNVQYQTGFVLPPGRYRAKVVVRENEGGTFGSFEADIVVPDLRQSQVKLSSVVLGTQLRQAEHRDASNPLARDGSELVPSITHVVSTSQPLYFYYEAYDPGRTAEGGVRLQTTISFFRGKVRRYETPLVELTQLAAPDRKAAIFQFSVPAASLKPGLYVCQVNVIDDVAGTFAFPRLALLVR
jgi:VWFA-related protein